ncbi:MAG: RNA-binding domain-containing protein [Promethearchaeota archaeon]
MSIQRINIVRKELTEKNLLKLINRKSESDRHDYKQEFNISNKKERYEFIKDISAFSNARGGYIIIGISDDYQLVGLKEKIEVAKISEVLESYFGFPFDIDHTHLEIDDKIFCLMYIPSVTDRIISCPKDVSITVGKKQKTIIRKGDVFFRRGTRNVKAGTRDYEFIMQKINYFENKKSYIEKKESSKKQKIEQKISSEDKTLKNAIKKLSDYWSKKADFKFVLTPDGKSTLRDFMQYFSVEELKKAMDIAFSKPFLKNIEDKFRYFCGIVHNWKSDKFDKGERSILKRAKSYFQSKPRGSGYFVEGRFIKYVSLFDWDTIKLAIDETFSEGRPNYFQTLCDILDNKIPTHVLMRDGEIIKIICAFCEGKGTFPESPVIDNPEDMVCDLCNGKGVIAIKCSSDIVKCRFCSATGKKYEEGYFFGDKCDVCKGLGIQPLFGTLDIMK